MISLTLNGVRTAVHVWGQRGRPVVVAHSAGLDGESAAAFAETIVPAGYQVYAPDLRGHGRSDAEPEEATLAGMADDLSALPGALGLRGASLIGTSLGGVVAADAVTMPTSEYDDLTILCSPDKGYPAFAERAEAVRQDGMESVVESTLDRWFPTEELANNSLSVRLARDSLMRMSAPHWIAVWNDFAHWRGYGKPVPGVTVRVIAGENDVSTPPAVMSKVAAQYGTTLRVLKDAPHQALLTHPRKVAREWLDVAAS